MLRINHLHAVNIHRRDGRDLLRGLRSSGCTTAGRDAGIDWRCWGCGRGDGGCGCGWVYRCCGWCGGIDGCCCWIYGCGDRGGRCLTELEVGVGSEGVVEGGDEGLEGGGDVVVVIGCL